MRAKQLTAAESRAKILQVKYVYPPPPPAADGVRSNAVILLFIRCLLILQLSVVFACLVIILW